MLLIKVDRSPSFVMKLPGTMEVRGELEEIRECWNLLMNTLGIGIEIEENVKESGSSKTRTQEGRGLG